MNCHTVLVAGRTTGSACDLAINASARQQRTEARLSRQPPPAASCRRSPCRSIGTGQTRCTARRTPSDCFLIVTRRMCGRPRFVERNRNPNRFGHSMPSLPRIPSPPTCGACPEIDAFTRNFGRRKRSKIIVELNEFGYTGDLRSIA